MLRISIESLNLGEEDERDHGGCAASEECPGNDKGANANTVFVNEGH